MTRMGDGPEASSEAEPRVSQTPQAPGRDGLTPEARADSMLVARAVRRAQAGDRQAFGFLYARFADDICGYVRSIVHDHHEAEDVTQHVFTKLMRVIGSYQPCEVPFFAWLLRVARNVAVDHMRRRRLVPVEEVRAADTHADASSVPGMRPIDELKEALASLSADQREVLGLRHIVGLSPTEIARRTGRTEGSIHGLHHRGRHALQAELIARGAAPVTVRR